MYKSSYWNELGLIFEADGWTFEPIDFNLHQESSFAGLSSLSTDGSLLNVQFQAKGQAGANIDVSQEFDIVHAGTGTLSYYFPYNGDPQGYDEIDFTFSDLRDIGFINIEAGSEGAAFMTVGFYILRSQLNHITLTLTGVVQGFYIENVFFADCG